MNDVSLTRLYVLRAVYAFMAFGLVMTVWPDILAPQNLTAGPASVIRALLGSLALLFALGVRYPLRMLPILLFELLWKLVWVFGSALPMWLGPGLDQYASETLFACAMGIVLVLIAMPWGYLWSHYVRAPSDRWRNPTPPPSTS